jgi:hypothetical protein
MSANDFKAQATNQSIGATSIPTAEAFGSTQYINTKRYLALTPIASAQNFPAILKNTLTLVNYLYPVAIASSQYFSNNDVFSALTDLTPSTIFSSYSINSGSLSLHSYIVPDAISGIGTFLDPIVNTVTSINFDSIGSIGSSEIFGYIPVFTTSQFVELLPINSIQSRESLGNLSSFQSANVIYQSTIASQESLSGFNVFGNIFPVDLSPSTIASQESLSGFNVFANIFPVNLSPTTITSQESLSDFVAFQNINNKYIYPTPINSKERFGTNIQFRATVEGISRASFIGSYVTLVNKILVEVQKVHTLDIETLVSYPLYNQFKPNYLVIGYVEIADLIDVNIQSKYKIETEITQEKISIAREKPLYLESYIMASQFIDTFVYNEQNNKYYRTKYTYNEK